MMNIQIVIFQFDPEDGGRKQVDGIRLHDYTVSKPRGS
jgi:hypothetical protein